MMYCCRATSILRSLQQRLRERELRARLQARIEAVQRAVARRPRRVPRDAPRAVAPRHALADAGRREPVARVDAAGARAASSSAASRCSIGRSVVENTGVYASGSRRPARPGPRCRAARPRDPDCARRRAEPRRRASAAAPASPSRRPTGATTALCVRAARASRVATAERDDMRMRFHHDASAQFGNSERAVSASRTGARCVRATST